MLTAATLTTALLLAAASPSAGSARLHADDLARGFGSPTSRLLAAVAELDELGLPVMLELRLTRGDGRSADGAPVVAAWRGDRHELTTDGDGRVAVPLDRERLDTLELRLPADARVEVAMPYLDELGFDASCPLPDARVRAAGC